MEARDETPGKGIRQTGGAISCMGPGQKRMSEATTNILAGIIGGAWGGAVVGLVEASVITATTAPGEEYWLFPYAVISYGLLGIAIGFGSTVVATLIARRHTDAFGLAGASALFLLGFAVARYHVIQRIFHEELVTTSATGLGVHLMIVAAVGALAAGLMYGAQTVQRQRAGLILATLVLLLCLGLTSGAAVLASPHAAAPAANGARGVPAAPQPNVILFILDTLRADAVGCYGAGPKASPTLDAVARDGVRFDHAYSQSSWTRPSIATILTSLYPSQHGLRHKMDALPDRVTTLAEAFHADGYYTAGFVSNINVAPVFNFQQGFDEYTYLAPDFYFWATDSATQLAVYKGLRLARERFLRNRIYYYNYYQDAAVVTGAVEKWLDRTPPQPFFLLVHFMDPHDPYFEIPYNGRGVARVSDPNPAASRKDELHRLYADDLAYLDGRLSGLVSKLKATGAYDNTVIAITADHGEEFQEHGGWWHGTSLYQEQVHIPLIVKRAHEAHGGEVVSQPARTLDIAPTLMAAAGLNIPTEFVGRDLFGSPPVAAPLFAEEELEGNVLASLRVGAWKLITANVDNPRGLAPVELYNLEQDAGEQHNLATAEHARAEEMLRSLAHERARLTGEQPRGGGES